MAAIRKATIDVMQTNDVPAEKADMTIRLTLENSEDFVGVNPLKFPMMMTIFVGNEDNQVVFYRRFLSVFCLPFFFLLRLQD